jgi:hypothetical protein
MSLIKSLMYSLKEARFNPIIILHSMLYAATVTYLMGSENYCKNRFKMVPHLH